jgi:hypothetical protein
MKSSAQKKQQLMSEFPIQPKPIWNSPHEMLFIGSCFSDEISQLFSNHFLPVTANPFGTIFSPQAIASALNCVVNNIPVSITQHQENHHALLFDSSFQHANKELLLKQIEVSSLQLMNALKQSETIFITLGSAWVYKHIASNEYVGNCHKIPQKEFSKELLSLDQIKQSLSQIQQSIRQVNAHCNIIFTISPVRHLRDGISENLLSKSLLVVALQEFLQLNNDVLYFPSFEIFQEELKDYRFYKDDLTHPNEWAVNYIFSRLVECFGADNFQNYMEESGKLSMLMNHLPKSENEEELNDFEKMKLEKIDSFFSNYPALKRPTTMV